MLMQAPGARGGDLRRRRLWHLPGCSLGFPRGLRVVVLCQLPLAHGFVELGERPQASPEMGAGRMHTWAHRPAL